ncbi:MAG TPA: response regulator transcription factor [Jatrophihabitans sp.]|jgi:DNA-binding response OmpR family regulator
MSTMPTFGPAIGLGSVPAPAPAPGPAPGAANASVLLIEDDPRIRQALTLSLEDEGYEVRGVRDGEEALAAFAAHGATVDVVLLDLMLPGVDGLTVCRALREGHDVPIIIVTARTDSSDVIAGLEAGADDYVTKPLVASELNARIKALLRRVRGSGSPTHAVGDLVIDPATGLVTRGEEELGLTKTEFRLLCELAAAHGQLVTREQLLERVWGYGYFGDTRLLDVHVMRLRRKTEENPSNPQLILTVRGMGYRIATAS